MFGYFDYAKYLLVALFCVGVVLAQNSSEENKNNTATQDPLIALIDECEETLNKAVQNSEDFRSQYRYWFDRYAEAIKQNPDSPYLSFAKSEYLSFANVLAEYETARRIADELAETSRNVRAEIRWRNNSGIASSNLYLLYKKEKDADAAIKSFSRCSTLMESNIEELKLFGNGIDRFMTIRSYVNSYYKRAELIRDAKGDYLTAARLFKDADDIYIKHVSEDMKEFIQEQDNYTRELLLSSSMLSYVKAGKNKEADQMFEMVQNLPSESRRYSPGWHLNDLLDAEYPERGIKYQEKLTLWIAAHPEDAYRHVLLGLLAFDQYDNKLYNSAIQTFNQLLNDYEDQAAENKSIKASVREACYRLVTLNLLVGQKEEAIQMAERFKIYADPNRPKDMKRVEELNKNRELNTE